MSNFILNVHKHHDSEPRLKTRDIFQHLQRFVSCSLLCNSWAITHLKLSVSLNIRAWQQSIMSLGKMRKF